MKYRVEKQPVTESTGTMYIGYVDDEEAGYLQGEERFTGIFYITSSYLRERYRGTKAVRATHEILKGVLKDYNSVMTRVSNKKNDSIKILLSAGFQIIGTVSYQSNIVVELLKIKENA